MKKCEKDYLCCILFHDLLHYESRKDMLTMTNQISFHVSSYYGYYQ